MKESKKRAVTDQTFGAWLIKCDPKVWDFSQAMKDGLPSIDGWSVGSNYRSEMMDDGDPVVFWVSGSSTRSPKAGVWGVGTLKGPRRWEPASKDSTGTLWIDVEKGNAAGFFVPTGIQLITSERFREKISRDSLRQHKVLGQMEVIRQPQMANPSFLTKAEFTALERMISGWSAPRMKTSTNVSVGRDGAGFGSAETNTIVEERAMQAVIKHYKSQKYKVKDVSSENLGWDVSVSKIGNKVVCNVEVKGVSGKIPKVLLTRNEMRNAGENPNWKLAIVTEVLSQKPKISLWSAKLVMEQGEPFVWQVNLNKG